MAEPHFGLRERLVEGFYSDDHLRSTSFAVSDPGADWQRASGMQDIAKVLLIVTPTSFGCHPSIYIYTLYIYTYTLYIHTYLLYIYIYIYVFILYIYMYIYI